MPLGPDRTDLGRLRRYLPWLAASGAATAGAAALQAGGSTAFERFFGPLPPTLTVATAGLVGLGSLVLLEERGFWRTRDRGTTARGLAAAGAATIPFTGLAIAVDRLVGFPADTNIVWPDAWLLYPSVVIVAQTTFHLVPLAALSAMTRSRFAADGEDRRTWGLILAAAAVEPAAQVLLGSAVLTFVIPQVYAFGVVELVLLRRFGYVPMLGFRLGYYLTWHVLWGRVRLA